MKFYLQSILYLLLSFSAISQAIYEEKVTSASNVGMTVSNLGIIGNSFSGSFSVKGFPSAQYPKGSGIEHLFDGGLWVGALINGSQIAVTSGAVDASTGYSTGKAGFEFSQAGDGKLLERSTLFDSPNFNTNAVSHQDFVCDFTDKNFVVPGTAIPINGHQFPLGIDVHYEMYNWNYSIAEFFLLLNVEVKNTGNNRLDSVYVGHWADGVVRNINITPPGGSAFFSQGGNGYIDSLSMAYEFDANGDLGYTESYFGMKFLGADDKNGFHHPRLDTNFKCNFSSWRFNDVVGCSDCGAPFPAVDFQKYNVMSLGLNHTGYNIDLLKNPNNRSNLISVGPFKSLEPGESINIAFAFVFAKKDNDGRPNKDDTEAQKVTFVQNATWAQTAYNGEDVNFNGVLDEGEDLDGDGKITRFVLPTPPSIPAKKVIAKDNEIEIYWSNNSENSVDPISKKKDFEGYKLYATTTGFDMKNSVDISTDLKLIAQYDSKGNQLFNDNGFDEVKLTSPVTFENDTNTYQYKYVIKNVLNGWQYVVALTAFDTGDPEANLESLESSKIVNSAYVFPGKKENNNLKENEPYAYPNPYYASAGWEGSSKFEEDRKMVFANLPKRCEIRIYTVNGDLVDVINHDDSYKGTDIKWFNTYAGGDDSIDKRVFSGGEHAWDLLSTDTQLLARGLYVFTVKDIDTSTIFRGQFVIIK
jgi:hypothetical protein